MPKVYPIKGRPIHPKFAEVYQLWNVGVPDEDGGPPKPIRAYSTIAKMTGVDRSSIKSWEANGFLDVRKPQVTPTDEDRLEALEQTPTAAEGHDHDPTRDDPERENADQHDTIPFTHKPGEDLETAPEGPGEGQPVRSGPRGFDPFEESAVQDARSAYRTQVERVTLVEHFKGGQATYEIEVGRRSNDFYRDADVWIGDSARVARMVASEALQQALGLAQRGHTSSKSFENAASVAERMVRLADSLAGRGEQKRVKPGAERAQTDRRAAAQRRFEASRLRAEQAQRAVLEGVELGAKIASGGAAEGPADARVRLLERRQGPVKPES